jgi:outer membrane receptor for ferrienterochelin and colicins
MACASTNSPPSPRPSVSPRLNIVWQALDDTVVHAGYSRYLSPPPFELVGKRNGGEILEYHRGALRHRGSTRRRPSRRITTTSACSRRSAENHLGLDTYYKQSHNLIDEGQFGAPIILTPFNYAQGKQYGAELTGNYTGEISRPI